jgi:hypothetical protein
VTEPLLQTEATPNPTCAVTACATCPSCPPQTADKGFRPEPEYWTSVTPCSSSEFLDAVAKGSRNGIQDGAFTMACPYSNYSSTAACDVLSSFDSILLMGDSFERHLTGGLFVVLRDNVENAGAMRNWEMKAGSPDQELCQGEDQFGEKECRIHAIYGTQDFGVQAYQEGPLANPKHLYALCPGYVPPIINYYWW